MFMFDHPGSLFLFIFGSCLHTTLVGLTQHQQNG